MSEVSSSSSAPLSERHFPLLIVGTWMLTIYACLARFLGRERIGGWPILAHTTDGREHVLWIALSLLAALYIAGYGVVRRHPEIHPGWIFGFAAAFCVLALEMPLFHSTDVHSYVNLGWAQHRYGMNPYSDTLAHAIPSWEQDPMFMDHYWVSWRFPYGPLFSIWARFVCWIGGGDVLRTVAIFKASNAAGFLALCAFVWKGAARIGLKNPLLSLYACAWCPLLLLQLVANGHNDIFVATFGALAIFLLACEASIWVLPALTVAALVKYATLPMGFLVLVFLVRKRAWKTIAISSGISAVIALGAAAPYASQWRAFDPKLTLETTTTSQSSVLAATSGVLNEVSPVSSTIRIHGEPISRFLAKSLLPGYAILLLIMGLRVFRSRADDVPGLLGALVLSQMVLVCLVSAGFYSWYICMFLPLALFLEEGHRLREIALVLGCSHLLGMTSLAVNGYSYTAYALPATVAPVLLYLAWRSAVAIEPEEQPASSPAGTTPSLLP